MRGLYIRVNVGDEMKVMCDRSQQPIEVKVVGFSSPLFSGQPAFVQVQGEWLSGAFPLNCATVGVGEGTWHHMDDAVYPVLVGATFDSRTY